MRLTSDFWVSAIVRRVFADGGFAAVERRGATEAGAIYIRLRTRDGRHLLFGPAPQSGYDHARPDDRLFARIIQTDDGADVEKKLASEMRFDPDLWVIELECDEAAIGRYLNLITP